MLACLLLSAVVPGLTVPGLMVPGLIVSDLRCEFRVDPIDMDEAKPRLTWIDSSPREGARQGAYQIQAASSPELLARKPDLWDSGLKGSLVFSAVYAGRTLESLQDVWWRVRVWDEAKRPSNWSSPAHWSMGLLQPSDWKARWVRAPDPQSPTQLLRDQFQIKPGLRRARAFVCGLGQYEMHLNGAKAGDDWITPDWTQYAKTCIADEYDVTKLLQPGQNAVAVVLGNGMYNMKGDTRGSQQQNSTGPDKLIAQIVLDYADGTRQLVTTGDEWKWAPGPETYSGVFGGEDFDGRRLPRGWDKVGSPSGSWLPVQRCDGPGGVLRGVTHTVSPLRVVETREPVAQTRPKPNLLVMDLGQNAPYVPLIAVNGPAGATVKMEPAEILKPDGTADQETMRAGKYSSYTLAGGPATWRPLFWYVGSRYWQVSATGPDGKPVDPSTLVTGFTGLMVHQAVHSASEFRCSSDLFMRIEKMIKWSIRSNLGPVISDCPHREKSGWLEQLNLMGPELVSSYDLHATLSAMLDDMEDAQHPDGCVPTMAPEYFFYDGGFADSDEWGGSLMLVADLLYEWYGDEDAIRRHYPAMRSYLAYLQRLAPTGILLKGLGDWNGGGNDPRTPAEITNTAYYYKLADTMARFADIMGHPQEQQQYTSLAAKIRAAFRAHYFDAATGKVGTGSQSGQATALDLGLIDRSEEPKVFERLLDDVKAQNYGISLGEVGHPALLHVLQRFGRSDLIYKIHSQTDRPGYGYQLNKGLTTLAESWDASPISLNHFMLGQILEWFDSGLGGLRPNGNYPGFGAFTFDPQLVDQIDWSSVTYNSVRGPIACSWKRAGADLRMDVHVPVGSTCIVTLPGAWRSRSLNGEASEDQRHELDLRSGTYHIVLSRWHRS